MWMSWPACSRIAATTFGWAWPVAQTAMPAAKSRNRLPSTSVTTMPEPDSATSGYARVSDGLATASSRAMISRAFGPGSSVTMRGAVGSEAAACEGLASMVVMRWGTPGSERRVLPAHLG
jgi:hypothetical protein